MTDSALEYWRGITECVCDSPLPIGGCLRCDLDRINPDCLEGPGRTEEERAADWRELDRVAPTPADKFALMFRGPNPDYVDAGYEEFCLKLDPKTGAWVRVVSRSEVETREFFGPDKPTIEEVLVAEAPRRATYWRQEFGTPKDHSDE